MLVTGIFSFSHDVFYPSQNKIQFLSHIFFFVCKINAINLDQSKNLSFGKGLNEIKQISHSKPFLLLPFAIMSNKSIACRCKCLAVRCLIEDRKSLSKNWHNSEKTKRAMMALNRSPESVSPQNEFYLLYYYRSNL